MAYGLLPLGIWGESMPEAAVESLSVVFSVLPEELGRDAVRKLESSLPSDGRASDGDGGLLLGDDGLFRPLVLNDEDLPGVRIPRDVVGRLFAGRFDENLTPAELSVLMALLCGKSLREMSDSESVSYETRRNQLASLRQKSGARRQVELVMIMSVLLVNFVNEKPRDTPDDDAHLNWYLEKYYTDRYRLHCPRLPSGRDLLVVDFGPVGGRPALLMHSAFFTFLPSPWEADELERRNLRILVPIRPGYFSVRPADDDPVASVRLFAEDVADFARLFNICTVPILSQTYGVLSAILTARHLEEHAPPLVISAPQYAPTTDGAPMSRNHSGWVDLARRHPRLLTPALGLLGRALVASRRFDRAYNKMYAESEPDRRLIESPARRPWLQDLLQLGLVSNIVGMRADVVTGAEDWTVELAQLVSPVRLLYGAHDPYSNHGQIADRLAAAGASVTVIDDYGQNSIVFRSEPLLSAALEAMGATGG